VARAAVFLDRDGVIDEPVLDPLSGRYESPYEADAVALCADAVDALHELRAAGLALVVVSNQPAAAKGTATTAALLDVQARVEALLADGGIWLDGRQLCLHHPEGPDPALGVPCECRKPAPGMLVDAAQELDLALAESWAVGDSDRDIEAGRRAGCRTILVEHPRTAHRRGGSVAADATAANLRDAVNVILRARALS
jgi:D-glycero-D-manno-heptose 1,7-bisphosphate phosphatase